MTDANAAKTYNYYRTHGFYEFPQNRNLVVLIKKNGQDMPVLSEECVDLLETAIKNAQCEGWDILPYKAKIALMKEDLLRLILSAKDADECIANGASSEESKRYLAWAKSIEQYAWEGIKFLDRWVYDVYPFRDNYPN